MNDLKTAAEKKVKESPYPPSAETYLKKIRKNLIRLLCQSDFAEAGTDVDLFGGKEAVSESIAKAVLDLYCLGEVLGVDIKAAIQKEVKKVLGDAGFNPPGHIKEAPPAAAPKEEQAADAAVQPVQEEKTAPCDSLPPKERYKAEFAAAKTEDIVKNVWKQVSADKTLPGADKFALQNDYREALGRVKLA